MNDHTSGNEIQGDGGDTASQEIEFIIKEAPDSYASLAKHYYYGFTDLTGSSDTDKALWSNRYADVYRAFENKYGVIHDEYQCSHIISCAVLTKDGYLAHIHNGTNEHELEKMILECGERATMVYRLLQGEDRMRCNERYYGVLTSILYQLDAFMNPKNTSVYNYDQARKLIRKQLDIANDKFEQSAQRYAKIQYFWGMINGVALWILLAIVLFQWIPALQDGSVLAGFKFAPLTLLAGGIGAIVSVMSRMTFDDLKLDYYSGGTLLKLLGGFRIVMGAILGTAIYVLVQSGLIPISIPEDIEKVPFFFAGIAFIAGFAERWAQDMLLTAKSNSSPK